MTALDDRPATAAGRELTTAQLLLEWDRRRPRSQQREIGMSEVGDCRRRAGYRLAGTEPTNPGGSVQAVMGTAVHAAVEQVFRELQAGGVIPSEDLVEQEVRFAGVLGHLDRYHAAAYSVEDTKTTTDRWLEHIRIHGPDRDHLWQISLYGAAMVARGKPVRRLVIDYLARDTGAECRWTGRFDPQHVRDALAWLDNVRSVPLEMLNRDHAPDSSWCAHCPFFGECWGETPPDRDPRVVLFRDDPDAKAWAQRLAAARADKAEAKAREDEAKGALDAVRPDDDTPVDVGHEHLLQWKTSTAHRLDTTQVRAEYARTGTKPPENASTSTALKFLPRET